MEHDFHPRPGRALSNSWPNTIFGFAKSENLTTPGSTPSPAWRERSYRAILANQRCNDTKPTLYVAKLDERATGSKNQFRVRGEPNDIFSTDRKAIAGIEQRSVHVAEQGYSGQRIGL